MAVRAPQSRKPPHCGFPGNSGSIEEQLLDVLVNIGSHIRTSSHVALNSLPSVYFPVSKFKEVKSFTRSKSLLTKIPLISRQHLCKRQLSAEETNVQFICYEDQVKAVLKHIEKAGSLL